jgi:hypothetical protein
MRAPLRILGVVLLVLGIVGLAYGRLTYTKETHDAKVGPIEFSVKDKETVRIPVWIGILTTIAGAALVILPANPRVGG